MAMLGKLQRKIYSLDPAAYMRNLETEFHGILPIGNVVNHKARLEILNAINSVETIYSGRDFRRSAYRRQQDLAANVMQIYRKHGADTQEKYFIPRLEEAFYRSGKSFVLKQKAADAAVGFFSSISRAFSWAGGKTLKFIIPIVLIATIMPNRIAEVENAPKPQVWHYAQTQKKGLIEWQEAVPENLKVVEPKNALAPENLKAVEPKKAFAKEKTAKKIMLGAHSSAATKIEAATVITPVNVEFSEETGKQNAPAATKISEAVVMAPENLKFSEDAQKQTVPAADSAAVMTAQPKMQESVDSELIAEVNRLNQEITDGGDTASVTGEKYALLIGNAAAEIRPHGHYGNFATLEDVCGALDSLREKPENYVGTPLELVRAALNLHNAIAHFKGRRLPGFGVGAGYSVYVPFVGRMSASPEQKAVEDSADSAEVRMVCNSALAGCGIEGKPEAAVRMALREISVKPEITKDATPRQYVQAVMMLSKSVSEADSAAFSQDP